MGQEPIELNSRLSAMKSRYSNAIQAFSVYEAMEELCAPNVIGENEAQKNIATFNNFKNFFTPTKEALRVYFLLELAKFFDTSSQALQITKIIGDAKNISCMIPVDLKQVESLLKGQEQTITYLKTYRDKYLAHDDLKKDDDIKLTRKKITELFKIFGEILNIFSSSLNRSTNFYDRTEKGCKNQTKKIIDYLQKFEVCRLQKIKDQYQKE